MNVLLRPAEPADVPALEALERHFPTDRFSRRALTYLVRSRHAATLIAEGRGRILGALVLLGRRRSRVARVYSVVVAPGIRNRGLGAALIREAEREARRRGRRLMSLEVRESNRPALALYTRLGYAVHDVLPNYYEDGATALRLRKPL